MAKNNLIEIVIHQENCTGCRICQFICSSIHQNKFSPTNAYIKITEVYELSPKITFLENCVICGECAKHCLYGALIIKEVST